MGIQYGLARGVTPSGRTRLIITCSLGHSGIWAHTGCETYEAVGVGAAGVDAALGGEGSVQLRAAQDIEADELITEAVRRRH